jgi:ribosome biogenesis GTPase / thiamine phosphate phosphatase
MPGTPEMVVGDWVLLDSNLHFLRLLQRRTCFSRKAAGSKLKKQLIAANIDTAFIVSSMNEEFNLSRIERFLALVNDSGAEAVILLSKADQAINPDAFIQHVQALDSTLIVKAMNCLETESQSIVSPWLTHGSTIAVLGSSGVGKSTLINTLLGEQRQSTGSIRENDTKGRHTTTRRSLIMLGSGGLILDTPGIREIQLADCKTGITVTFSDIERYAEQCRFNNCKHHVEPGCAVQQAIESGDLDARRLANYLKLRQEEVLNSASLSEKRASGKALSKSYKRTQNQAHKFKGK